VRGLRRLPKQRDRGQHNHNRTAVSIQPTYTPIISQEPAAEAINRFRRKSLAGDNSANLFVAAPGENCLRFLRPIKSQRLSH
jgi:hypothetical protein